MSTSKLQSALAKSLAHLKSRDQIISTLKTQLRATQGATAELPTSTPPQSMKLDAAAIDAQNAVEAAKARASAAEARTAELQVEVQQLVEASKQGGEAQAAQMQTLQKELSEAKKEAAECKDAKVSPPLTVRPSLHSACCSGLLFTRSDVVHMYSEFVWLPEHILL